jgi:hypothetical protein
LRFQEEKKKRRERGLTGGPGQERVSLAGPGTAREPLGPGKRAAGPTIEIRKEITSGPRKERERERCKTKKDRER